MRNITIIFIVLLVMAFNACVQKGPERPAYTPPPYYTHVVSSQGETLANIAKWYTGAASNWNLILDHNPGLDVRRMRIGTEVRIPNNMLVKTTAMPKVKSNLAKKQPSQPQDEELLQPAQENLASTQSAEPQITEQTDSQPGIDSEQQAEIITETPQEEVVVKQLTPEEIAAMNAIDDNQAAPTDEGQGNKSFFSKFQEAAKAREKSLNKTGETGTSNTGVVANPESAQQQIQAADEQVKAAQEAANAQIKAAEEQSANAMKDAQKQIDQANETVKQQDSLKTRDDLIKELTEDY